MRRCKVYYVGSAVENIVDIYAVFINVYDFMSHLEFLKTLRIPIYPGSSNATCLPPGGNKDSIVSNAYWVPAHIITCSGVHSTPRVRLRNSIIRAATGNNLYWLHIC